MFERGLPVTPPAEELPVVVHEHDGFAITFWKLLRDWNPRVLAQLPEPDPERLELLVLLRAAAAVTWGWFIHGPNERVLERLAWLEARA